MPLVYQQNINAVTKVAVWHITESEEFFLAQVPLQREIRHWHKRLQHLAGRLLLKEMYTDFPVDLILIADTKKPYLENEPYHFSISHCGDYAAVIVSRIFRVGVDVERINLKIQQIQQKFTNKKELEIFHIKHAVTNVYCLTLYWCVKEAVYKWWGSGGVDFKRHILIKEVSGDVGDGIVYCLFKNKTKLAVHYIFFENNFLTWVLTDH